MMVVRPIERSDKELLARGFEQLSAESRYRRFLSPLKQLSSSELAYLTEIDHKDHDALIALSADNGLVGVARYVRLADQPEAGCLPERPGVGSPPHRDPPSRAAARSPDGVRSSFAHASRPRRIR